MQSFASVSTLIKWLGILSFTLRMLGTLLYRTHLQQLEPFIWAKKMSDIYIYILEKTSFSNLLQVADSSLELINYIDMEQGHHDSWL